MEFLRFSREIQCDIEDNVLIKSEYEVDEKSFEDLLA